MRKDPDDLRNSKITKTKSPAVPENAGTASAKKRKKITLRKVIRSLILFVCAAVFVCSAGYIADYYVKSYQNSQKYDEVRQLFEYDVQKPNPDYGALFEPLLNKNLDTVGWIKIDGTDIDYPVVQSQDDDFYLTHDFEKDYNVHGTLFAHSNCTFDQQNGTGYSTIIYGHNMKDGSMFGQLLRYKKLDFYKQNPVFTFVSRYHKGSTRYKVFSVFLSDTAETEPQGKGGPFNYQNVTDFNSLTDYREFVNELKQRSIINTTVDIKDYDRIVMLSTCSYDFDNARLVVAARQVRPEESETQDTSKASANNNAVYPYAYWKRYDSDGPSSVVPLSSTDGN